MTQTPIEKARNTKVRLYRMSTSEHECPWGLKAVNLFKEKGIECIKVSDGKFVD